LRAFFKIFFLFLFFVVPLLPYARTKDTKSQLLLRREIDFAIKRSNTPRTVKGIEIYSRKNKKRLFDFNSGFLFNPASNLKIVTTSFALQNIGINYKFKTVFAVSGVRRGNTIDGDLIVFASADPLIIHDDLDSVALTIARSGVGRIDGNLIIDVSRFDSLEWGSGWMWDDEPSDYQMFIGPASLDHNAIMVHLSLDSTRHGLSINTVPVTKFVRIVSTAVLESIDSIYVTRIMINDSNTISISGKYSPNLRPSNYTFSVRNPAYYFGTVLKEMLDKYGIKVRGDVITEKKGKNKVPAFASGTLFTLVHSIDTVITYVNKVSDNLGAECLLRIVPNESHGEIGSARNGIKMEKNFLSQLGVDSSDYSIVDGSGLSRYNLITPEAIVKVLNYNLDQPFANLFMRSLPVSGEDGTLQKRLTEEFTTGNIHAKTGSINGVSTLSGYVMLPEDTLVFSMMMQNFVTSGDSLRALQDSIGKILSLYDDNSIVFKKKLKKHNVGTYCEIYQRTEMNRTRKKRDSTREF